MTDLLMLDVRTLAFVSSVGGFLLAATMFGIYLAGMRSRAVLDWACAGLAFSCGYLLGHLLQTVDLALPAWFGASLANALIALGHGLILIGVQRYLGMKCWTGPILLVVLVIFVSTFLFSELRESLRWRIVIHSGWYVLVDAWAGWLLWRARRPGMERFHQAVAGVLLLFASFLALRLAYALFSPALTTSFVADPFQLSAFLAAMVFGFFLTVTLVVMLFREKQLELLDQARKDPLTGMNNRLSLDEAAEREMRTAASLGTPLSLMLFDIDHFKKVNDSHGHVAGDVVLRVVADRAEDVIRSGDLAFRFGGEEFLVLLPGASSDQAAMVAERLRQRIADGRIQAGDQQIGLTASFGVVQWRVGQESWEDLVKRADQALYQAKNRGRDQVVTPAIHIGMALPV
jgi:diguanylate cyclase (GGDEF)-like protein